MVRIAKFLLICYLFSAAFVYAQLKISDLAISADNTSFDTQREELILEGNVHILFKGYHLSCDRAIINRKIQVIEALGNVIWQNPELHAESRRMVMNFETLQGTFYDGFVQSGKVIFEGTLIEKIGDKNFIATGAEYTACYACPADWSFSGSRIEAEMGGYAHISYPIMYFGYLPVLALPEIIVPLKTERQSGFLIPGFGFDRIGGFRLEQSYFWAISRSQDTTLRLARFDQRGWKSHLQYRYVFTQQSRGEMNLSYMRDSKYNEGALDDVIDRGMLTYSHRYLMPHNILQRTDLNFVSDLQYPADWPQDIDGVGSPALENRISITKTFENHNLSVDTLYYLNMLQENSLGDNRYAVHKFPEIRYSLTETEILNSRFYTNIDVTYTSFTRSTFSYDDLAFNTDQNGNPLVEIRQDRDGQFDPEQDVIRTGHRLIVEPSLSLPFQLGSYFDILPRATLRNQHYRFNSLPIDSSSDYSNAADQSQLETSISAKTVFSGVFEGYGENSQSRYKHEVEPQVEYKLVPWSAKSEHSFFGEFDNDPLFLAMQPINDSDLANDKGVQFDYYDRLFNYRIIQYSLTQRVIEKVWSGQKAAYRTLATWQLSQFFDFNQLNRDNPEPFSEVNSLLDIRLPHLDTVTIVKFYPYESLGDVASRLRLKTLGGSFFQLTYDLRFPPDENNDLDFATRTEIVGTGLGLRMNYLTLGFGINYNMKQDEVVNWTFSSDVSTPGNCWRFIFSQRQVINRQPFYSINFDFNFDG